MVQTATLSDVSIENCSDVTHFAAKAWFSSTIPDEDMKNIRRVQEKQHFTGRQWRLHDSIISNNCHVLGSCFGGRFEQLDKGDVVALAPALTVLSRYHHSIGRARLQVNKTNRMLWSAVQPLHGHSSVA